MITKTRHIPSTNDPEELRRFANRVWDKINQVEQEQGQSITRVTSSLGSLQTQVNNTFTAAYVTRLEVENDGSNITYDEFGHAALVPYTLKVLA